MLSFLSNILLLFLTLQKSARTRYRKTQQFVFNHKIISLQFFLDNRLLRIFPLSLNYQCQQIYFKGKKLRNGTPPKNHHLLNSIVKVQRCSRLRDSNRLYKGGFFFRKKGRKYFIMMMINKTLSSFPFLTSIFFFAAMKRQAENRLTIFFIPSPSRGY